jgi:hypothetical protein
MCNDFIGMTECYEGLFTCYKDADVGERAENKFRTNSDNLVGIVR